MNSPYREQYYAAHPDLKERLIYSRYIIREKYSSKYVDGLILEKEVGMTCPKCNANLDYLEHGRQQKCHNCSLNMRVVGNCLMIWGD